TATSRPRSGPSPGRAARPWPGTCWITPRRPPAGGDWTWPPAPGRGASRPACPARPTARGGAGGRRAGAALRGQPGGKGAGGVGADVLDGDAAGFDLVLAGDAFYSAAMSDRMTDFLRRAARAGARVLAGDPERKFLRRNLFRLAAGYEVPVPRVLEGVRVRQTSVWELPGRSGQPERQGS